MQLVKPLRGSDPLNIGPFSIDGLIGEGGFGVVYLGRTKYGSPVAIKVMSSKLRDDKDYQEHLARFHREVNFLKLFSHPFVPKLVKSGWYGRLPYLATEYIPGPTLHDLVAVYGPLPVDAVWGLAAGLADILHNLHRVGVHRDVKPGNVLMTLAGPHLIDFGLAHVHDAIPITQVGTFVGTRGYMDPAGGAPADIFGLGGTAFFAATGYSPHQAAPSGSSPDLPDDSIDLSGAPGELRDLLESCLHDNRLQRPRAAMVINQVRPRLPALSFAASLPTTVAQALGFAEAPYVVTAGRAFIPNHPFARRRFVSSVTTLWHCQLADRVQAVLTDSPGTVRLIHKPPENSGFSRA